ncbi:unnamed protein product, partial [Amoebophrya sp. A25]
AVRSYEGVSEEPHNTAPRSRHRSDEQSNQHAGVVQICQHRVQPRSRWVLTRGSPRSMCCFLGPGSADHGGPITGLG